VDRKEDDFFVGRTEFDSPEVDNEVIINAANLKIGEFYKVKIDRADNFELFGSLE
jgi:ribosomal protein S12 methylthiotransferase